MNVTNDQASNVLRGRVQLDARIDARDSMTAAEWRAMVTAAAGARWPRRRQPEYDSQVRFFALVRELARLHPDSADVLEDVWATSNGGKRPAGEAGRMRAAGQRKGVLDIECMVPRRTAHGLFIEMKSETGQLTPEQAARIQRLRRRGYVCTVARSWPEAGKTLCGYLGIAWPENAEAIVEGSLLVDRCRQRLARSMRRTQASPNGLGRGRA